MGFGAGRVNDSLLETFDAGPLDMGCDIGAAFGCAFPVKDSCFNLSQMDLGLAPRFGSGLDASPFVTLRTGVGTFATLRTGAGATLRGGAGAERRALVDAVEDDGTEEEGPIFRAGAAEAPSVAADSELNSFFFALASTALALA